MNVWVRTNNRVGIYKGWCVCSNGMGDNEDCQQCKDDRVELGRKTWYVLHRLVEHNESRNVERSFKDFMNSLSYLYPCPLCAKNIRGYLNKHEVHCTQGWMIDFHNDVNRRLGKPIWLPKDTCLQKKRNDHWFVICFMYLIEKILLFDYKQEYKNDSRKYTQYWKIFLLNVIELYIYTPSESLRELVKTMSIDLETSSNEEKLIFKCRLFTEILSLRPCNQNSMALYTQYSSSESKTLSSSNSSPDDT